MNLSKPTISFFCPAYNDEENLPLLIPKALKVLKEVARLFEIVIVEDGSPDNTDKVADLLQKKYPKLIRVIHHKKNKGYGAALKKGFLEANAYDYVFFTDGDNQFDVSELRKMVPFLKTYSVVIGYRKKRALTVNRLIQTHFYNWLVRTLFHLQVKDINCSMKIIKRDVLTSINLFSTSPFIEAELLIKLKRKGVKIKEVGVSHYPRLFGKASGGKPSVIIDTLKDLFTLYRDGK